MNIGGNQPNPASNLPTTSRASEPQHSADVDPNKLLLMLPDLDKRAREFGKLARTTEQTQDKVINDAQNKALVDFAKSLISEPTLPAGSKAALENWVNQVTTQPQTATPDGKPAQTGQATQTPAQPGAQAGAQTGAQTGAQAGTQTTAQPGTQATAQPGTQTTAQPGAQAGAQVAGQTGTQPGTQPAMQAGAQIATPQGTQTGTPQPGAQQGAQTTQTAPQTGTQTTQGQQAATFGGDPTSLLTDDPSVSSTPVKQLGKMASTIASAQGGKLTQEQVTLLANEASDLFTATPSKLTDADKAVLLSFISQLEEFPTADDPKSPDSTNKSSNTSSSTANAQNSSQAKSAKAPDLASLVMDELGLGSAVQELGKQALTYVQGNNGKLGEKEAEQLKMAAEELIAGGADGDDLKALQNFIKALLTFPKTASGPADSPLLLTQPGIDPGLVNLSQMANSMMKGQGNTLTQPEVEMLKNMAEAMMSELSPEDQAVLKTWLATLGNVQLTQPPKINVFHDSMLFGATPKSNPFMSPGIMTMLAPILGEILSINNDIIRQSSKLKQNMMKLLVAMANEAFKFAMAAGQAAANKLMTEAAKNMTLGISQCIQGGMSIAMVGVSARQQSGANKEAANNKIGSKMENWASKKGDDGKPIDATRADKLKTSQDIVKQEGVLKKGHPDYGLSDNERVAKKLSADPEAKKQEFTKMTSADQGEIMSSVAAKMQGSSSMAVSGMVNHLGQATDSFVRAGFDIANVKNVLDEAAANAYKDMIGQLMQLVTGTIQSASDEMQTAQKNFESFAQLYKDFANTITQGIYRSG